MARYLLHRAGWRERLVGWLAHHVLAEEAEDQVTDWLVGAVAPWVAEEDRVVCLGASPRSVARLALRASWAEVVGLFPRRERAPTGRVGENLFFRHLEGARLPLSPESADAVICWPGLFLGRDIPGLGDLLRLLRVGGLVAILHVDRDCSAAATSGYVAQWRHPFPGAQHLEELCYRHVVARRAVSLEELVEALTRAGVVRLEARRLRELPFVFARARRAS